jgi:hypothetical protein
MGAQRKSTKVCTACLVELPRTAFGRKDATGSIKSKCKKCLAPDKARRERYRYKYDEAYRTKKIERDRNRVRHGMTSAERQALKDSQNGLCACCGAAEATEVDHDHKCCPGRFGCSLCVRAMLCGPCNSMLGHAGDSIERLNKGAEYLQKFLDP